MALVAATTRYTDGGLRQLRAPAQDAADLAQVLADPGIGGFAVTSVIDQTAQQLRLAVEDILADRGTQDLLLVYLSCHGLLDAHRTLFFAATDTRKDRVQSTGVEAAWVLGQLEHCRARRQILILDSCFSGAFAHGAKGDADLGLQGLFAGHGRGRIVLTASNATEYSFEGQPTHPTSGPGSVFTTALIKGLRTGAADTDHDGHITVDDAYSYAYDQVMASGAAQTPQRWLYGAEGKIVLARSPAGKRLSPESLPGALRAELGSEGPTVASTAQPRLNTSTSELALPPVVKRTASDRMAEGRAGPDGSLRVRGPSRIVRTLVGQTRARAVAFSPDGSLLASAGADGVVRLWRVTTGAEVRKLTGHTGWVYGVAFSPDGSLLASGGDDGVVRLWEVTTGAVRRLTGHIGAVYGVAFSPPDGTLLASAGFTDGSVRLWEVATGTERRRLIRPHSQVNRAMRLAARRIRLTRGVWLSGVAFNPDGSMLASAGLDNLVRLWEVATGAKLRKLTGHTGWVNGVAFSPPDGSLLASAGDDKTVRLWDVATGAELRTLTGHDTSVSAVAFSPDGSWLASVGTIRLYGCGLERRPRRTPTIMPDGTATSLARSVGHGSRAAVSHPMRAVSAPGALCWPSHCPRHRHGQGRTASFAWLDRGCADLNRRSGVDLPGLAREINPQVRGWINYYGAFFAPSCVSWHGASTSTSSGGPCTSSSDSAASTPKRWPGCRRCISTSLACLPTGSWSRSPPAGLWGRMTGDRHVRS
jgi:WD40 repeat protein